MGRLLPTGMHEGDARGISWADEARGGRGMGSRGGAVYFVL